MSQVDGETISTNLSAIAARLEDLAKSGARTLTRQQLRMCVRYATFARELAGRQDVCTKIGQLHLPKEYFQRIIAVASLYDPPKDKPDSPTARWIPYSLGDWTDLWKLQELERKTSFLSSTTRCRTCWSWSSIAEDR